MFLKFTICSIVVWAILPASMLRGEPSTLDNMVDKLAGRGEPQDMFEAIRQLGNTLRTGSTDDVRATRNRLCQEMTALSDLSNIQRFCLVLASAPNEEAVSIVLDKLRREATSEGRAALCNALGRLLYNKPVLQAATRTLVVSNLEAVLNDRHQAIECIDQAQMALAYLGDAGFDALIRLKDSQANPKIMNIFYTALSLTNDVRAISVLHSTIADESTSEGTRAAAIHALGQLFASLTSKGESVELAESISCVQTLYPFLADSVSDKVFAVTLGALGKMVFADKDVRVRTAVVHALSSGSKDRRLAALGVVYMTDGQWDAETMARIQWISKSDDADECKSEAEQIFNKIAGQTGIARSQ